MTTMLPPRSRKRGIGCLPALLIFIVVGPALIIAIDLLFAPWIFRVGDRTRLLPVWAGVGVAQTASGTYKIGVMFSPTPSGSRILPSTSIVGSGYVCAPTGQRYTLRVTGGASGRIWKDMDGHSFYLSIYNRPFFSQLTGDRRPRLSFTGQWVGPNLQMNDAGSIAHAFLPNGTLSADTSIWHTKTNATPITFTETTWWWLPPDCGKPPYR